jgi:beta-glucosidase-like glycosyl hydrolase
VPTTNFPEPVGLAATLDTALLKDVITVIREENQRRGLARLRQCDLVVDHDDGKLRLRTGKR